MKSFCHCFVHCEGIVEGLHVHVNVACGSFYQCTRPVNSLETILLTEWFFFYFHCTYIVDCHSRH